MGLWMGWAVVTARRRVRGVRKCILGGLRVEGSVFYGN